METQKKKDLLRDQRSPSAMLIPPENTTQMNFLIQSIQPTPIVSVPKSSLVSPSADKYKQHRLIVLDNEGSSPARQQENEMASTKRQDGQLESLAAEERTRNGIPSTSVTISAKSPDFRARTQNASTLASKER